MERKDVTVQLGTARAVAGAGLGGTPPVGDGEAADGHLGDSEADPRVAEHVGEDDLIRRGDLIDRVYKAMEHNREADKAREGGLYGAGYHDALADLADALTGWCSLDYVIWGKRRDS